VNRFEYLRAGRSAQALSLARNAPDGQGRLLAGGTDLLPLVKDRVLHPSRLVDIKRLADVDRRVEVDGHGITLGGLATLADVAAHERLAEEVWMLVEAARSAATPQLRAVATVAGNLLQRPRCWYYRNHHFHCWLQGGEHCPARDGQNQFHAIFPSQPGSPCCAVHPSDLAPCLLALEGRVRLRNADGQEREVEAERFFREPTPEWRTETVLDDEVLVSVALPPLPAGTRTGYAKAMTRKAWSFALASVAAAVQVRDGLVADARLALGGVAGVPLRARRAEAVLRDRAPSDRLFEEAADRALEDARPLAHNAYKIPLTRGLLVRTLRELST
jgi:xanthine dehydrogenase YagS FAD-binding subunit